MYTLGILSPGQSDSCLWASFFFCCYIIFISLCSVFYSFYKISSRAMNINDSLNLNIRVSQLLVDLTDVFSLWN